MTIYDTAGLSMSDHRRQRPSDTIASNWKFKECWEPPASKVSFHGADTRREEMQKKAVKKAVRTFNLPLFFTHTLILPFTHTQT